MIAAVVLAAGAATRFGGPKQQVLLPRVLERLTTSPVDEIVVVAGAYELEGEGARIVECPAWERGRGASLRCGLVALGADVEAAIVCLADGPNIAPESVARVLAAWRVGAGAIVAGSYAGNRGHPVAVSRHAWGTVPDEGLHALPATLVPCDDLGSPGDVDTADELRRLHPPLDEN